MDEIKFGYSTGITDVYLLGEEESLSNFENQLFDEDSFFVIDSDVPDNFVSSIKDNYNSEVIEVNDISPISFSICSEKPSFSATLVGSKFI